MDQDKALTILRGMEATLYYLMNESRLDGWDEEVTDGLYELAEQMEPVVARFAEMVGR